MARCCSSSRQRMAGVRLYSPMGRVFLRVHSFYYRYRRTVLSPYENLPTSAKAADLMLEFCMLFGIGSIPDRDGPNEPVPQPIAAFLAVLALPLYNSMGLQPLLPIPKVNKTRNTHLIPPYYVRKFTNDLAFYMALSICPDSVGSIIWSIFWEPGLNCNLSSAWFTSILEVLNPIIKAGDFESLVKVFMARRRPTALLWFGVLFLGDRGFLDKIVSYLETHNEQLGDSWSRPDVNVAVWTGLKQSFLDEPCTGTYDEEDACVSRSDLLRHRFNYRLNDPITIRYVWQPNGYVMKAEIERELWPRLATNNLTREYKYWIWWIPRKDGDCYELDVQPGFLHEVKVPEGLSGNMHLDHVELLMPTAHRVRVDPSRDATFSIVAYGAKDATEDRSLEAMGQGIRDHPWMAGSRGA